MDSLPQKCAQFYSMHISGEVKPKICDFLNPMIKIEED